MSKRHARPARRLNADRIEPGRDPDVIHLRRKAEVIGIVGGKAFGAIEERVNPRLAQHRHAVDGPFQDRLEVVEILGQLIEFKAVGNARHAPGLGVRLEGAKHHLARVFLVIGAFIGHPQDRQLRQTGNRFADDIKMLAGLKWHVDARHAPHLVAPHARAIDDHFGLDMARTAIFRGPVYAGHPAALAGKPGDLDTLLDQGAAHPRALGQSERDIGRVALAVLVEIHPGHHVIGVEMGVFRLDLGGADFLDIDTKGAGHCRGAKDFLAPLVGERDSDRADALEAGGDAGFLFQRAVEFLTVLRQPGHVRRRAQLCDQARRMPCGARGQLFAFQQDNILPAQFGQVIGHGTAHHAATDNDHTGLLGNVIHNQPRVLECLGIGR